MYVIATLHAGKYLRFVNGLDLDGSLRLSTFGRDHLQSYVFFSVEVAKSYRTFLIEDVDGNRPYLVIPTHVLQTLATDSSAKADLVDRLIDLEEFPERYPEVCLSIPKEPNFLSRPIEDTQVHLDGFVLPKGAQAMEHAPSIAYVCSSCIFDQDMANSCIKVVCGKGRTQRTDGKQVYYVKKKCL